EDPAARLLAMSRVLQPHERKQLLLEQFRQPGAEEEIAGVVRAHMAPVSLSPLGETLHLDTRLALVDNMLLYFDKMSMAASLEVRVPFMDHDVVAFCSRLRLATRLAPPPERAAPPRESRLGRRRHHRQAEARVLP